MHSFMQDESAPIQKEALVALIANQDDRAIDLTIFYHQKKRV